MIALWLFTLPSTRLLDFSTFRLFVYRYNSIVTSFEYVPHLPPRYSQTRTW